MALYTLQMDSWDRIPYVATVAVEIAAAFLTTDRLFRWFLKQLLEDDTTESGDHGFLYVGFLELRSLPEAMTEAEVDENRELQPFAPNLPVLMLSWFLTHILT